MKIVEVITIVLGLGALCVVLVVMLNMLQHIAQTCDAIMKQVSDGDDDDEFFDKP